MKLSYVDQAKYDFLYLPMCICLFKELRRKLNI